jgi:hypothetical protein
VPSRTAIVLVDRLPMVQLAIFPTVDDATIDPCTRSTKLRTALWESGVAPETDFGVFRLRLICSCRARISILAFRLCCGHARRLKFATELLSVTSLRE